jgi:hypothetical protein
MPSRALQGYLRAVRGEYASDRPTEHSYRPVPGALLERTGPGEAPGIPYVPDESERRA